MIDVKLVEFKINIELRTIKTGRSQRFKWLMNQYYSHILTAQKLYNLLTTQFHALYSCIIIRLPYQITLSVFTEFTVHDINFARWRTVRWRSG